MSRVWSSDGGALCPDCERPRDACVCRADTAPPTGDGTVRIAREVKGRRGKAVTVIRGLPLAGPDLAHLARELKQACGAGGSVKDGSVEIQGDKRDQVAAVLRARGFRVKLAGG
ncbi:MAG: stress response translation initiation inhibitor YciH [Candidatus Krumholzibacteriia bacterium]